MTNRRSFTRIPSLREIATTATIAAGSALFAGGYAGVIVEMGSYNSAAFDLEANQSLREIPYGFIGNLALAAGGSGLAGLGTRRKENECEETNRQIAYQ